MRPWHGQGVAETTPPRRVPTVARVCGDVTVLPAISCGVWRPHGGCIHSLTLTAAPAPWKPTLRIQLLCNHSSYSISACAPAGDCEWCSHVIMTGLQHFMDKKAHIFSVYNLFTCIKSFLGLWKWLTSHNSRWFTKLLNAKLITFFYKMSLIFNIKLDNFANTLINSFYSNFNLFYDYSPFWWLFWISPLCYQNYLIFKTNKQKK